MNNLNELIPILLIAITCATTAWGLNNTLIFQRYQFKIGEIRYNKQYRRLITSAFLHADWLHLFFNMFTLYFFSRVIVYVYGVWLFLLLYFGAVLAGSLFSLWLYKNRPSYTAIGASGGVSGVLFAAIAIAPLQTIYLYFIPVTAWIFATLYFAYSATMMLKPRQWDNTGHAAHLGGAVCGMAFVAILTPMLIAANALFIGIMSLPLLYLAYEILINKRGR
ncbi:rhomboid family intramembrane serine protease [Alysiella filiformis]|uniref:Membrane associated serine protease, rhomboid family n=1 Tax=Alysiella filiformis DSM 16848 TaxID=1120981 RepID=A0A286ES54_9NEIS|nr:rhomboid family intramembrane serine protease [Alysiella filiformis]QMT31964.1 rhomboid family intramembrane serine protease [Alysiella filiformis]UBQ57128.1 rhomboid family intramembrane serine protease [Alysiella filiformis DSM 16848]SOD73760.1 Membrane associated serine protease, rhomboid family [Alysiella filiformis DSM 16848]